MTNENREIKKAEKQDIQKTELTHDRPVFTPLTDIYEKDEKIQVVCDMPGVDKEHIDISLENDVLTVCGYQTTGDPEGYDLLHQGYYTGIYQRSFSIPSQIDKAGIKAGIKKGILHIELPKAEEAKPRKITVNAE